MKKTKAKETAAGAEMRRRAKLYEADAARTRAKDPGMALRLEGRADGYLDAAVYIDEYLGKHKPGEELPDAGDVADLAMMQRADSRLDDLERRVVVLELERGHASKGPVPPSLRDGGLLSPLENAKGARKVIEALERAPRAKALRPTDSRPKLTNGAPLPEEDDDPDVAVEAEASDYDLALILALGKSETPLTAAQAALLAGFSPMSGALAKGMRRLRRGGVVAAAGDGRYRLTERGQTFRAATSAKLRTAEGLLPYWAGKLGEHKGTFLSIFAAASPKPVTHEELAQKSGFSKKSGAFPKALRRLRRMHLLEEMRLSVEFVEILELKP